MKILQVDWVPGSDRLRGRCHCGAETVADDPVEMWEWLLNHPNHPFPVREGKVAVRGGKA